VHILMGCKLPVSDSYHLWPLILGFYRPLLQTSERWGVHERRMHTEYRKKLDDQKTLAPAFRPENYFTPGGIMVADVPVAVCCTRVPRGRRSQVLTACWRCIKWVRERRGCSKRHSKLQSTIVQSFVAHALRLLPMKWEL
jgi:hypothetical protein